MKLKQLMSKISSWFDWKAVMSWGEQLLLITIIINL